MGFSDLSFRNRSGGGGGGGSGKRYVTVACVSDVGVDGDRRDNGGAGEVRVSEDDGQMS